MRQDLLFPFWIDQAVPPFWMISSFLLAAAFERHGSTRARDELARSVLAPRLSRVAIPYMAIFALMLAIVLRRGSDLSSLASHLIGVECSQLGEVASTAILWFAGGVGPRGYYVPIPFQMYVLFPFMYAAFRKKPPSTFLAFLVANIMWEAAFVGGVVSDQAYRLLIPRYLVFLLLGAWFYRLWSSDRGRLTGRSLSAALACCLAGAGHLAAVNYLGLLPLAGGVWMSTSWITALYSGSVFCVLLAAYAELADGRSRQPGRFRAAWNTSARQRFMSTCSRCCTSTSRTPTCKSSPHCPCGK